MKYKISPHECDQCGNFILIDQLSTTQEGDYIVIRPQKQLIYNSSLREISHKDEGQNVVYDEFKGRGRRDLVREILDLRQKNKELETAVTKPAKKGWFR